VVDLCPYSTLCGLAVTTARTGFENKFELEARTLKEVT
jgi:hypothetical protein